MSATLSDLRMQVMWTRLISVVEEQAQTLMRTAFSTTVRDAGDLSAAIFDRRGRLVVQGRDDAGAGGGSHLAALYFVHLLFLSRSNRQYSPRGRTRRFTGTRQSRCH